MVGDELCGTMLDDFDWDLLVLLGDSRHLIRDRALVRFRGDARRCPPHSFARMEEALMGMMEGDNTDGVIPWERCVGGMLAAAEWVSLRKTKGDEQQGLEDFVHGVRDRAVQMIAHPEVRVRQACGEVLGALAETCGPPIWNAVASTLLRNCEENLELDEAARFKAKVSIPTEGNAQAKDMVHDTEGWKGLETSMIALDRIVRGCGQKLVGDQELDALINLALRARTHPNRFVRESSMNVFTDTMDAFSRATGGGQAAILDLAPRIAHSIAVGLEDNWSQVRYASAVCVRKLMTSMDFAVEDKEKLFPLLVPRMCLNRHYVAEGVKLYSLETWKVVMGTQGKKWLSQLIEEVIEYLEQQTKADNHAVREASCQTFSEIAVKLDESVIECYVVRIIHALIDCFKDQSWPVRDHACTACSLIVEKFPLIMDSPSGRNCLQEICELWLAHLADNIPSVRENSAKALGRVVKVFPSDHPICGIDRMVEACRALLPSVQNQKRDSSRYGTLSRETHFGSAHKIARDNDPELHTDQTLYSCGSLAPKLKRGGGCMDHGFSRQREPWEESDGALRMWRRLVEANPVAAGALLPEVVLLTKLDGDGFAHAPYFLETLWTQLGEAIPFLDKISVAAVAPEVTPALKSSQTCGHSLAESAAKVTQRRLQRAINSSN